MQMIRAAHQASYLRHGMMKNSSHNRFTCTDMIRFMVNTLQKAKLEKRLKFMSQLSFRLKKIWFNPKVHVTAANSTIANRLKTNGSLIDTHQTLY